MAILKGIKLKDDDTVHQLDYENGIANKPTIVNSYNDLDDKPFYSDGYKDTDVVENKSFTFTLDQQYGALGIFSCNPVLIGELTEHFVLVENAPYKVDWDDTTYECNGLAFDVGGVVGVGIGNAGLLGAGDDTGEPFVIMYIPDFGGLMNHVTFMTADTSNSHDIRIYQQKEIVCQIPSKYVDGYTREEIDNMFGAYVDEVDALLGGNE